MSWNSSTVVGKKKITLPPIHTTLKKLSSEYKTPMQLFKEDMKTKRTKKEATVFIRNEIKSQIEKQDPSVSQEKKIALSHKILELYDLEEKQKRMLPFDKTTFFPDLTLTTKNRRYNEYTHTGSYQFMDAMGAVCWTCCLAENQCARGCQSKTVDPDKWMLSSI